MSPDLKTNLLTDARDRHSPLLVQMMHIELPREWKEYLGGKHAGELLYSDLDIWLNYGADASYDARDGMAGARDWVFSLKEEQVGFVRNDATTEDSAYLGILSDVLKVTVMVREMARYAVGQETDAETLAQAIEVLPSIQREISPILEPVITHEGGPIRFTYTYPPAYWRWTRAVHLVIAELFDALVSGSLKPCPRCSRPFAVVKGKVFCSKRCAQGAGARHRYAVKPENEGKRERKPRRV